MPAIKLLFRAVWGLAVGLVMTPIFLGMLLWTSLRGVRPGKDGTVFGTKTEATAIKNSLATTFSECTRAAGTPLTQEQALLIVNAQLAQATDEQIIALGASVLKADLIWRCFEKMFDLESCPVKEKMIWFAQGMKYVKPFHEIDLDDLLPIQRTLMEDLLQRQVSNAKRYRAALSSEG